MYLMGIVNATFVARRPTDHVELVDLSVEKKEAQDRYNKEHKALTNGTRSPKPGASPRHHALEAQPADLCMEPLFPLFLTSASSDSSSDGDTPIGDTVTIPFSLEEASVNVVPKTEKTEKTLEDASSRKLELEQESRKQAGQTTKTESKTRVTPKLGRIQLSDGGVSTRVQRHPLEVIPEQEQEHIVRAKIDRPARVLLHPLERIDEDPRKPTKKKERKNGGVVMPPSSPQPGGRKFVRESKPDVKQQPPKRERAKPRQSTKPRNPKPDCEEVPNDREKPSLASPVMEKMEGLASPEPSWNQKFQNLPKLAVSNSEPLMEERELRYSSPKMTESDVQDELSFRVWERECVPKRKSISVSSDFQDLDLETCISANPKSAESTKQQQQLSPLRTFPVPVEPAQEENIIHHDSYPSPSSIQCGLSPTSLFSDDDNIFSRFQQFPEFGDHAPRSDEVSDSSETGHHRHHASSSTYNDESSDLESPNAEFSTFTYTDKEIELTTSEDENVDGSELRYFQEANRREEPWLEKNGGVLDDTDLEFLLPLETTPQTQEENSEISEENPKDNWIPCDDTTTTTTTTRSLPRRQHSRSSSKEKLHLPRRSVKFATDLVREISPTPNPNPKSLRLPRPESSSVSPKDEDEHIYPSVKSWEVKEEVDASRTPPPRRRWRTARNAKCEEEEDIPRVLQDAGPSIMSSRRRWRTARNAKCEEEEDIPRVLQDADPSIMSSRRRWRRCREKGDVAVSRRQRIMPCAGRLFSWPQRLSAFKVSRSSSSRADVSDDDDESIAGTESFGRSARRDAQQVRRILKGSQKRFSNLTVADILTDNFQDRQPTPEAAIHQGSESDTRTHN